MLFSDLLQDSLLCDDYNYFFSSSSLPNLNLLGLYAIYCSFEALPFCSACKPKKDSLRMLCPLFTLLELLRYIFCSFSKPWNLFVLLAPLIGEIGILLFTPKLLLGNCLKSFASAF